MKKQAALILAVLVVPVAAWFCRGTITSLAKPKADNNLVAYTLLIDASHANDVTKIRDLALAAGSCATDPQLLRLTSSVISSCDMFIKMNISSITEANSLGGMLKALRYGVRDPAAGMAEVLTGLTEESIEDQGNHLTSIYAPQGRQFGKELQHADSLGTDTFILVLLGGWIWLWRTVKRPRPSTLAAYPAPPRPTDSVILVCVQCGAKNRQTAHVLGQNLVCGNCKMLLPA